MPFASVAILVDQLRELELLEPAQFEEVVGPLQAAHRDPRLLVQSLVTKGWLTRFQADRLLDGDGNQLVLDRYLLLDMLGEGGMGQVYKARHRHLDRIDALKVVSKEILRHPEALKRFQREARAVAKVAHPHIVTIYDAAEAHGVHYLAMEYLQGTDLDRLVRNDGPLAVERACDYLRQAALGLDHAHQRGLVHRDVKPANLFLVTSEDTIKVLDLGLARSVDAGQQSATGPLTSDGAVMGTPDYIAPEQAKNSHAADHRADVYSLGCTLYYLLTGKAPFNSGTVIEKLLMHQMDEPPPVQQIRSGLPPALVVVLRRMMVKRPESRYQTAREVAEAMRAFCCMFDTPPPTLDVTPAPASKAGSGKATPPKGTPPAGFQPTYFGERATYAASVVPSSLSPNPGLQAARTGVPLQAPEPAATASRSLQLSFLEPPSVVLPVGPPRSRRAVRALLFLLLYLGLLVAGGVAIYYYSGHATDPIGADNSQQSIQQTITKYFLPPPPRSNLFTGSSWAGWDAAVVGPAQGDGLLDPATDPRQVVTLVEDAGVPAVRVTGAPLSLLTTKADYDLFSFSVDFKLGAEPPVPTAEPKPRRGGILYHCSDPVDEAAGTWQRSLQCRILERDTGCFISGSHVSIEVHGDSFPALRYVGPTSPLLKIDSVTSTEVHPRGEFEKPRGQWNKLEIYCTSEGVLHILNGQVVLKVTPNKRGQPGTNRFRNSGRLQIQTEGTEVFYRNPHLTSITRLPDWFRDF